MPLIIPLMPVPYDEDGDVKYVEVCTIYYYHHHRHRHHDEDGDGDYDNKSAYFNIL